MGWFIREAQANFPVSQALGGFCFTHICICMLDIVPTITTGGHWEKSFAFIFPKHFEGIGFYVFEIQESA
jgi:hypothetical protein